MSEFVKVWRENLAREQKLRERLAEAEARIAELEAERNQMRNAFEAADHAARGFCKRAKTAEADLARLVPLAQAAERHVDERITLLETEVAALREALEEADQALSVRRSE